MKTRCAKCGKVMKSNGPKWGMHKKCESASAKKVSTKLNERLSR